MSDDLTVGRDDPNYCTWCGVPHVKRTDSAAEFGSEQRPWPYRLTADFCSVAEYVVDNHDEVQCLWEMRRGPAVAARKEVPFQACDETAERSSDIHFQAERISGGDKIDVSEHLIPYDESCLAFRDDQWHRTNPREA